MNIVSRHHEDRAISTHCQGSPQRFLRLLDANGYDHDFFDLTGLFHADRLFDRNFIERVHRHFYIGKINTRSVRFYTYFNVIVDHALNRHQYLHQRYLSSVDDSELGAESFSLLLV